MRPFTGDDTSRHATLGVATVPRWRMTRSVEGIDMSPSSRRHLAVGDPVRPGGGVAEGLLALLLVLAEVAIEKRDLGLALEGEDVRRDTGEEVLGVHRHLKGDAPK